MTLFFGISYFLNRMNGTLDNCNKHACSPVSREFPDMRNTNSNCFVIMASVALYQVPVRNFIYLLLFKNK